MDRKKYITAAAACLCMILIILDSRCALESGQQAIELCLKTVVPSLFPFLFLSGIITGELWGSSVKILKFFSRIFHIPTGAEALLLAAVFGGYPAGAVAIGDTFRRGQIDASTAQRLLTFCNNAGPAFLFGMLSLQFPEKWMVWCLWGIHLLSAAMVSSCITFPSVPSISLSNHSTSVSQNMVQAAKSISVICGWIILFRIIIGFLDRWILWIMPDWVRVSIWGLLELSNGCCSLKYIENISCRFMIASAILAFGGVCVAMQTAAVISGLSIKGYLAGKILQMVFSIMLAAAVCSKYGIYICIICVGYLYLPRIRKKRCSNLDFFGV